MPPLHSTADPLIHTLLTTKWHRFGGASLTVQFAMYLVLVVIQTFLCWLHSDVVSIPVAGLSMPLHMRTLIISAFPAFPKNAMFRKWNLS